MQPEILQSAVWLLILEETGKVRCSDPLPRRRKVLEEVLPPAVLWDYDTHAFEMEQMKRLRRWHMYWMVYLIERTLFKLEKWGLLRENK